MQKLRLGCSAMPLSLHDYKTQFEALANLGFKQIEILSGVRDFPEDLDKRKRKELLEMSSSYGLNIYSVSPGYSGANLNLISLNPAVRRITLKQVKDMVHLTGDLGGKMFVLCPGMRWVFYTIPFKEAWEISKRAIIQLGKIAENLGVTLCIEQLPFGFLEMSEDVRKMAEEINMDSVKVMLDTSNTVMREPITKAIKTVGEYLVHMHLSDCDGKNFAHWPIGRANIDFAAVAQALKEVRYNGVCILEVWDEKGDPAQYLADSKNRLEKLGWQA